MTRVHRVRALVPVLAVAVLVWPAAQPALGLSVRASSSPARSQPQFRSMENGSNAIDQLLAHLSLGSITCPDASTCFAVGSHYHQQSVDSFILATHDGGAGWSTMRKQSGVGIGDLTCPGPLTCFALGGKSLGPASSRAPVLFWHTSNGFKTWQAAHVGPPGFLADGLACPSSAACYIIGQIASSPPAHGGAQAQPMVLATMDGGQTWIDLRLPQVKALYFDSIACADVTTCDVGGTTPGAPCFRAAAILRTSDGGKTWDQQLGDCAAGIWTLACPTARTCYAGGWYDSLYAAGGQLILHTEDGGTHWDDLFEGPIDGENDTHAGPTNAVVSIACPNAQTCFASTGNVIVATADGGVTWAIHRAVAAGTLDAISCPTTRMCLAVGMSLGQSSGPGPQSVTGLIVRTTDGGKTWTKL